MASWWPVSGRAVLAGAAVWAASAPGLTELDAAPPPAGPSQTLSATVERAVVTADHVVEAGPLLLVRPAADVPVGRLRSSVLAEAAAAARSDVRRKVAQLLTTQPDTVITGVRVEALRTPAAPGAPLPDPAIDDWWRLGAAASGVGHRADDPVIVRATVEAGRITPLSPAPRATRVGADHRAATARLLAARRTSLAEVVSALGLTGREVGLLVELDLRGLTSDSAEAKALRAEAVKAMRGELEAGGLRVRDVVRTAGVEDAGLGAKGLADGLAAVLLLRVRETTDTISRPGRCKSAAVVDWAFYIPAPGVGRERKPVLGTNEPRGGFTNNDTCDTPVEAARGTVEAAVEHLAKEGRLLELFSTLLVARWAPAAG